MSTAERSARILLYDIETAPSLGYVWGKYQQDVMEYEREGYIICFAWKWLGDKKVNVIGLPDFKLYKKEPENDVEVLKKLHSLFTEADIIIAHNGNKFDQKVVNTGIILHDLDPPAPSKYIDTRLVAKRYFFFNSNKLDDLAARLGIGRKLPTGGFGLWRGCMAGDKTAWKKMMEYNKHDVRLLEGVYLKMRPWIDNHPALNLIENNPEACPKCGAGPLTRQGTRANKTTLYQQFKCSNCGGWSRARVAEKTVAKPIAVN